MCGKCIRRGCNNNAQSGYVSAQGNRFCKPCFAECHPRLYAARQKHRRNACQYCKEERELQNGFCRPCRRARACDPCHGMNIHLAAAVCKGCSEIRKSLGAHTDRLALWCSKCYRVVWFSDLLKRDHLRDAPSHIQADWAVAILRSSRLTRSLVSHFNEKTA